MFSPLDSLPPPPQLFATGGPVPQAGRRRGWSAGTVTSQAQDYVVPVLASKREGVVLLGEEAEPHSGPKSKKVRYSSCERQVPTHARANYCGLEALRSATRRLRSQ